MEPRRTLLATDEALHPMLRHVLEHQRSAKAPAAAAGAQLPMMSLKFLAERPAMWPSVLIPALLNVGLFLVSAFFMARESEHLLSLLWAQPTGDGFDTQLMLVGWWVVYLLFVLLGLFLAYMSAVVLGSVLASPFLDAISERTEKELLGTRYVAPPAAPFFPAMMRSLAYSAIIALLYVALMIPLLFLHLIPLIGSLAYTAAMLFLGATFVAIEFTGTLLERHGANLNQKIGSVRKHHALSLGFGLGTKLMLAIPLLNFMCIPVAVVGGTALGLGLEQWWREEDAP